MPMFDLVAAAVQSRSRVASAQRLLNLYAEQNPDETITLYGTPGLKVWLAVGSGPIRGLCVANNLLYVVSGNQVFSVTADAAKKLLGTIGTTTGMVSMASNGVEIQLVDGSSTGYLIALATNTLSTITDPDFKGGVKNGFIDGFTLFNQPGTGKFWATSAYAAGVIDPLSFATAEGAPDPLVSLLIDHREIWLFGTESVEVWYNAGNAGFPFDRVQGAFIEHGCAAAQSVAKMDNTVFWLGQDDKGRGMVWKANGYSPQRISTHNLETQISNYAVISDAVAWTYQQDGHAFYVITFPTQNVTWCYDASTDSWHERSWRKTSDGSMHRHRVQCHAVFAGKHIGGDWETGNLYVMDMDTYTDNGDAIVREVVGTHMRDGFRRFYSEAELIMETGVGLLTGQGTDPQVMLSISKDGGRTYPVELWRSLGPIGNYLTRVIWHRLGAGFQKTFKIRITDPVKIAITGARVEFTE